MAARKANTIPTKPAKQNDEFLSAKDEAEHAAETRYAIDEVLAGVEDPWIDKFNSWGRDVATNGLGSAGLFESESSEPRQLIAYDEAAKEGKPGYVREEDAKEGLIFDPRVMGVPMGTASRIARYRAETSGSHATLVGQSVVGLGNTNLQELWRVASWMMLHNPFAANVIRSLAFLTIGEGPTISWPGGRTSGNRKATAWSNIVRKTGFNQKLRRTVRMTFGLGEYFVHPTFDPLRKATAGKNPNRILTLEPDRIARIWVNDLDTEDVHGYEVAANTVREPTILNADEVVHSRIGDFGNVPRGISILLPALKYLRFAELFLESRHWLTQIRSRLPVVRKVRGSKAALDAEKIRFKKLPPPGTIALEGEGTEWQFPSLNLQSADASDDFLRVLLAIAAAVGLPLYMVGNDPSSGTYAGGLLSESPTVRMIREYRTQVEENVDSLVATLSGQDEGWKVTFPPVLRRAIGESAAAFVALTNGEIWSRRTACEESGKEWEGKDGERARIMAERSEGFGDSLGLDLGGGDDDEPATSTAGDQDTAPGEGSEELPNTRPPKPPKGIALGKKGSSAPRNSGV